MRKRISERNVLPGTDLFDEYRKLEFLFSGNNCIGEFDQWGRRSMMPQFTLEQYFNDLAFSDWDLRGTAISFYNMRDELGLSKERISSEFSTDLFIDFIELCLNCVFRISITIEKYSGVYISDRNILNNIIDNCHRILEKLNYTYKLEVVTDEIYVYAENAVATAVAETNEDVADSLIEYRRHDMKGDLKRKGEILCTLFKKLESVEKKFKGTTYEKLISDTTFLFNKTGIRHWVEQDKIASETFIKMDSDKLEKWYDTTYDLFLSCMVISSYLDIKKEIEEIKRTDGE